jgi:hypothetical protein
VAGVISGAIVPRIITVHRYHDVHCHFLGNGVSARIILTASTTWELSHVDTEGRSPEAAVSPRYFPRHCRFLLYRGLLPNRGLHFAPMQNKLGRETLTTLTH